MLAPATISLADKVRPRAHTPEAWSESQRTARTLIGTVDQMAWTDHAYGDPEIREVRRQLRGLGEAMRENLPDRHILSREGGRWEQSDRVGVPPEMLERMMGSWVDRTSFVLQHPKGLSSIVDHSMVHHSQGHSEATLEGLTDWEARGRYFRVGESRIGASISADATVTGGSQSLGLRHTSDKNFLLDLAEQRSQVAPIETYEFGGAKTTTGLLGEPMTISVSPANDLLDCKSDGSFSELVTRAQDKAGFRTYIENQAEELTSEASKSRTSGKRWLRLAAFSGLATAGFLASPLLGMAVPFLPVIASGIGFLVGGLRGLDDITTADVNSLQAEQLQDLASKVTQAMEAEQPVGSRAGP